MFVPRLCAKIVLSLIVLFGFAPAAASAQTIQCVSGCLGTVSVTPDGADLVVNANTTLNLATFGIAFQSGTTTSRTFALTCTSTGGVTCGTVTPSSLTLQGPGDDGSATVKFNVSGTGGLLRLRARYGTGSIEDYGSYNIKVRGPTSVALRNHNADNMDRSLCLTSGAGEAAAAVCGDLVVSHGTPGYTTLGRERSLTLVYNSRTAYSRPIVTAAVTQPAGVATPNAIYTELEVAGGIRASATYGPWSSGITRQIALGFDAVGHNFGTGVYPFTLRVQSQYTNTAITTAVSGNLIIVNRYDSEFGAGVWLAGVERILAQPDGSMLWFGGDGSAKVYGAAGTNQWVAPAGAFRDTLVYNPADLTYTRTLRHGVQVTFNAGGFHIRTTNRTGQQTIFNWPSERLTSITVPPTGATGTTYTLAYDGAGKLDQITDPSGRVLNVTVTGGVLTGIADPDGGQTSFGYNAERKMTSRTNRRAFATTYEYAKNHRLTKVTVPAGRQLSDPAVAVTQMTSWDEQGLAFGAGTQTAVDTAKAYTRILGPRFSPTVSDTAAFWVDRFGAPTKIVNGIGVNTRIVRGQTATPALVTQVIHPNNRSVTMSWNTRGNLAQVRDSTTHLLNGLPFIKTVTYDYGSAVHPDSPTLVTDGLGRTTSYSYTALGLTDSVIDPRGHRTKFLYDTSSTSALRGVVKQIIERQVETWRQSDSTLDTLDLVYRFSYDASGNAKVDTAANKTVTSYVRDLAGRVTSVFGPLDTKQTWTYDDMNRVWQSIRYATTQTNPYGLTLAANCDSTQVVCIDQTRPTVPTLTTLTTRFAHGAMHLDSVMDPRAVTRAFEHDARGLVWKEIDEVDSVRTASYGLGGTLDTSTSRAKLKVIYQYDALGRRTQMSYPERAFNGKCDWSDTTVCWNADSIPGETITYTYDSLNNLLTASGAQGTITRRYYADGSLSMKITNVTGLVPDTLIYSYDPSGARSRLIHARDMRDTTDYFYGGGTGDLDSLKVRYGAPLSQTYTFGFAWDGLGRRKQVLYPIRTGTSRMSVTLSYDAAGTLRELRSAHPDSLPSVSNRLNFTFKNGLVDAAGRILEQTITCRMLSGDLMGSPCAGNGPDKTVNRYNRLSMLVHQTHSYGDRVDVDSLGYDASGNMAFRLDGRTGVFHSFTMKPYQNRLEIDHRSGTPYYFTYTADGSRRAENATSIDYDDRWYTYDGLERMSGSMRWDVESSPHLVDSPVSCLYDPDGQMVKPCDNGAPKLAFEGNNVVAAGNVGVNWSFVHGPALDDPLMGLVRWTGGTPKVFFWVTDGQGRHFVFADSAGALTSSEFNTRYGLNGGKFAGGTSSAGSFNADRFSTPEIPGFSFFRHRAYDRNTGRWTQEDPIGITGGLNLYQFNGNNPVSSSDPFGLAPCKVYGNCTQSDEGSDGLVDPRSIGGIESTVLEPSSLIPVRAVSKSLGALFGRLLSRGAAQATTARVTALATAELAPTHGITLSRRAMQRLTDDIAENGIREPIKYVEHNGVKHVVDGHHRLRVARNLGMDEVPVERVELPYKGYRTAHDLIYEP